MAVSEDQTEEALGYAAEGKKFAKEYTPPDVSVKDAVKFVAEMTPVIGDAMAAKEVWDELQKEEINWRMVGILAGAGAVGLVPFFGDAAGKLIKQGASKALKPAKSLDAVATGVPQYKMDGNAPASVFDSTVTQEAVDFIQSGSTSQKDLLRIARDNGIVSGPGTGTMPAQVIAELGDRVRNPDFKVIPNNKKELPPAENSAKTQIAGTLPTYKKADTLLTELAGEGKTLDFGAGLGLSKKELGFDTYEPFPKGDFSPDFVSSADIKDNTYKKVTNLNVLNVVPRSTRDSIVKDIGRILKPDGRAVITTRGRDVLSAKGTSGPEPMSIITSMDTYQKGFTQPELKSYITDTLGKGFEVVNNKLGAAGVTVHKLNTKNFNEGGAVNMDNQMRMFEEGGIADDGMTRDPVSGNEVPPGSLAREVRDDVPAQLSDGEYVVPADVVRFFGVRVFEEMRMEAKMGLQQMEQDGRIGGEPTNSTASQSGEKPLSPEEQELLQEIMSMDQSQPQQQQPPQTMANGGVIKAAYGTSVGDGSAITEDIAVTTRDTTDDKKSGMRSFFYIHPDGRRIRVLTLNGNPVGNVPDDFSEFVTDTPENRVTINFKTTVDTPSVGTAGGSGTGSKSGGSGFGKNSVAVGESYIKANGETATRMPDEYYMGGGDSDQNRALESLGEAEFKAPTFDSIGINGLNPLQGAMDALANTRQSTSEEFLTTGLGIIGTGVRGITQSTGISIAHANALYATQNGMPEVAAEINAAIQNFVDDESILAADLITDIASGFVRPGQNLLDKYNDLGGVNAQKEEEDGAGVGKGTTSTAADPTGGGSIDSGKVADKNREAAAKKAAAKKATAAAVASVAANPNTTSEVGYDYIPQAVTNNANKPNADPVKEEQTKAGQKAGKGYVGGYGFQKGGLMQKKKK